MTEIEHLLTILGEECAEVAQRASKAIRFGLTEVQDGQTETNAQRIVGEMLDLIAVAELLEEAGALPNLSVVAAREHYAQIEMKKEKVRRWMAYARNVGTLTERTEKGGEG